MRKVMSRVSELVVLAVLVGVIAAVIASPSWIGPVDRAIISISARIWPRPPVPRPPPGWPPRADFPKATRQGMLF
jgi:hypothetical protein